jgi:hypothetical protein
MQQCSKAFSLSKLKYLTEVVQKSGQDLDVH